MVEPPENHHINENMPRIVKQFTSPGGHTRLTIRVPAANKLVAKQRARIYTRRHFPGAKNVLTPEVSGSQPMQTTFNELFPETLNREEYDVDLVVK